MSLQFYHYLHLIGLILVFVGYGGLLSSERAKSAMMWHGIGLLISLVSGFGMLAKLGMSWPWPLWIWIKVALWLVLGFLPVLYPVFWIVPLALLLVTSAYAVQSASGAASNQVVVANIIGFSVMVLVLGVIAMSGDNAPMGAGIFAFLYEIP